MAVQYLLPCDCGSTTPIDTNQAGSSVACTCGKQLEVPSLRAIRQLTPLADDTQQRHYQWNPVAGMVFVSGLVLALAGAVAAVFMHLNSQGVHYEPPPAAELAAWVEQVNDLPPEQLLDEWMMARQVGLGEYQMSPSLQARQLSQRLTTYRNTGVIVMASGIVFAGASIFLRSKSS